MIDTMSTNKQTNVTFRTIYIDLNGVLDMYAGWTGKFEKYPMRPGADTFLKQLFCEGWKIRIFTATQSKLAEEFLQENDLMQYIEIITNIKGPGVIYLDDRGLKFEGNFEDTLQQIHAFKTFWEQE